LGNDYPDWIVSREVKSMTEKFVKAGTKIDLGAIKPESDPELLARIEAASERLEAANKRYDQNRLR